MSAHIELRSKRELIGLSQARLAEISGVPQHALSAYELGKASLKPVFLKKINSLFKDAASIEKIVKRKKRYTNHVYQKIEHDPVRLLKYKTSKKNKDYLKSLKILENWKSAKECGLNAVSIFSGCGGFSLGFKAAGINILGFVEIDAGLREIYKSNFTSSKEIGSDILQISDQEIQKIGDINKVDILIGGPPCQGFSLSGKRKVSDPRNILFHHYMRFLNILKPSVALLENVRLLTSMKSESGRLVKEEILEAFEYYGYEANFHLINAKECGVPQHRERVIFTAVRKDLSVKSSLNKLTSSSALELELYSSKKESYTFADACSDLPYLESGEKSDDLLHSAVKHPNHVINWLWDVAEGRSAHDNLDISKRPPSGYNTTYKRQVWSEPASTVQTTFGMISGCRNVHPICTRALTIREAARIQSFPDNYAFSGNQGTIRTGIGNAVPPMLAYKLASFIRDQLL